jgi:hypothetical protein
VGANLGTLRVARVRGAAVSPEYAWHYTTDQHALLIRESGHLVPATSSVPGSETPVVWLSTHQHWEPAANKGTRAIDTKPKSRTHKSGTDTRSGKEGDGKSDREDVSVIKPGSNVEIKVEGGRLTDPRTPGSGHSVDTRASQHRKLWRPEANIAAIEQ